MIGQERGEWCFHPLHLSAFILTPRHGTKAAADKKPKTQSKYNAFMAAELPKMKVAHPELDHKAAFKKVAESWANHPSNPKNK